MHSFVPDPGTSVVVDGESRPAAPADLPDLPLLQEAFEAQVERSPEAAALVQGERVLSYGELNARANRLARRLRGLGVGPDARVAICAERGPERVVGVLAVLKAGGAYVPLDPAYPAERLAFMLEDSSPAALLTQGGLEGRFGGPALPVLDLGDSWAGEPDANLDRASIGLTPDHLAYVIYTSGSTGTPKGVMVEHRGLAHLLQAQIRCFEVEPESRVLQFASFSFDACVFELALALGRGAALHLPPGGAVLGGEALARILEEGGITHATLPPAVLATLPPEAGLDALHTLISAGEALPEALARRFAEGRRLFNAYGPTEASVWCTLHECRPMEAGNPPIGRPIADARIYLLDGEGRPVAEGETGEIHIGGAGVARGYLNRPELTAERFLPDPFAKELGTRMYRSGDLGRLLPDGVLAYLGREDFQVKVRGFRIELGEIEARLLEHLGIQETVVVAREDLPGEKRLVAYYRGSETPAEALKTSLSRGLPEHMVPSAFVHLETWPLTPNGKVDRKALPAPGDEAFGARPYEAPEGEIETALAALWARLLQVERVGRRDDFFALGGHSLLAARLLQQMREAGMPAEASQLFAAPTVAGLAAALRGASAGAVEVPANRIPKGCGAIRPDMLTLVELGEAEIAGIVRGVPGGASNVQDIYPLAPLQEGILFHHRTAHEGDPYQLPSLFAFETREGLDAYLGALQAVVDRNDALRTSMAWEGLAEPVQVGWCEAPVPVEEVALDPAAEDAADQLYARFDLRRHRLDVRRAPLVRAAVAEDPARKRWLLHLMLHHLAADHTAYKLMQEEIRAHLAGRASELPTPQPFRNFVARTRLGLGREEHEAFFRRMLGNVDEPTAPFGLLDVRSQGGSGIARLELDPALAAGLRERARRLGVSAASLLHLAWAHVLARVSGREDVVFGTVLFGRMEAGEEAGRTLGLCINTLPVRVRVGDEEPRSAVRRVHGLLTELIRHEHAPLALAQRCSAVPPPAPLFSSLLNYRHSPDVAQPSTAQAMEAWGGIEGLRSEEHSNYPLSLDVDDLGEGFLLTAQAQEPVDPARVCAFMGRALEQLVEALDGAPDLDVLPEAERSRVVEAWNATEADFPGEPCLHQRFEAQAARRPEALALIHDGKELTYGELNARANQLAHHLRGLGVGPDDRVLLCAERGLPAVVGLLAILKAGGAYVPLDPAQPVERARQVLEYCAPQDLLGGASFLTALSAVAPALPAVDLGAPDPLWSVQPRTNPGAAGLGAGHLAYVIYTSGSTGRPKGVMMEHRAVVHQIAALQARLRLGPEDRILQFSAFHFDVSVEEIFGALLSGATLVLRTEAWLAGPREFWGHCRAWNVSVLDLPARFWKLASGDADVEIPPCVRQVITGGEIVDPEALAAWFRRPGHRPALLNAYGPTETTTNATLQDLDADPWTWASIGRPMANTKVYVLDGRGRPAPVGVAGDLHIGGAGVARGYLNRPELTAERFLADPFVGGEARMYRTGDRGRWRPDGSLEFLGREDFQVKVRGFRVELGEIEARLREYPGLGEPVVVLREDLPGDPRLVAYVTASEGQDLTPESLREHLAARLPDYMLPAAYVRLESLPLTPSGKLDRRALPAPEDGAFATRAFEAPSGAVEETLAALWRDLLKVERVGRQDHFFQLGGHSLLAVTLIERLRRMGLHVDAAALFLSPTLHQLAAAVRSESALVEVPPHRIPPGTEALEPHMLPLVDLTPAEIETILRAVPGGAANIEDVYPLAPLQEGILFHHRMATRGDVYILSCLYAFEDRARLDAYLAALQSVIDRHDVLRTAVLWEGLPEPVQVVWRRAELPVEEVALQGPGEDRAAELFARFDPRHYRFDLGGAPMLRAFIARDGAPGRWLLLLLNHHLSGDHTSLEVMQEEIQAHLLGQGDQLPAPVPFRNFVAQARLGLSAEAHEAFFREMLSDVEEPTAPFGLLEVQGEGEDLREACLELDGDLARRLRKQAGRMGVGAATLCHLAWAQVLARAAGREDVVFGTVLFGRMQGGEGADRAMGLFMNTLPVRIRVGDDSAETGVRKVHQLLAGLMRHEHASLALAQRCSAVSAPAPLFSSLLNYRHSPEAAAGPPEGIVALAGEEPSN